MIGNLRVIGAEAWHRKRIVFATMLLAFLLALTYLHIATYKYDVTLLVTPVSDQAKGKSGMLSSLASVAGIDLSAAPGEVDPFDLFLQGINTRQIAEVLASDQGLMRELFPAQWDEETKEWRNPSPFKTGAINALKSVLGLPLRPWTPPNGALVADFITQYISVVRDPRSQIVTITMRYDRPEVAKHFLGRLHTVDDNWLRQQTLIRTSKYIEYLNGELQRVTVEEYRQALGDILSEQEKRRMFASSPSVNYSAQIFEAPTAAMKPASPNTVAVLLISLILGALTGVGLALTAADRVARRLPFLGR